MTLLVLAFTLAFFGVIESFLDLLSLKSRPNSRTAMAVALPSALFIAGLSTRWLNQLAQRFQAVIALTATILLFVNIGYASPLASYPELWSGFGIQPVITNLLIVFILLYITGKAKSLNNYSFLRNIFTIYAPIALLITYTPLFIQPSNGLINLGDTTYHVLDEILAPIVGRYPYGDYSPQYSAMLGWLLYPLNLLNLSGATTMVLIIVVCNVLTLLVPVLVALIQKSLFPKSPFLLTLTMFVALWAVCGPGLGATVQLREFSHFARYVPALLALYLFTRVFKLPKESLKKSWIVSNGVVLSFAILNSPDVGLALGIALFVALLPSLIKNIVSPFQFGLLFSSAAFFIGFYFLALVLLGKRPSLISLIGIRSGMSGLYPSYDFQLIGPHMVVMAIAVAAIATGAKVRTSETLCLKDYLPQIVSLAVGIWTLILLPKFLLFPHPVGVPSLFIPAFICAAVVVGIGKPLDNLRRGNSRNLFVLPILFVATIPVGAIWQHSNPADEVRRIFANRSERLAIVQSGRVIDGWSSEALAKYDDLMDEVGRLSLKYKSAGNSVGYFGLFGNTVELLTGVSNFLGIPAPESLRFGSTQEQLACEPVSRYKPGVIIVYASAFPCMGYVLEAGDIGSPFSIYRRQI